MPEVNLAQDNELKLKWIRIHEHNETERLMNIIGRDTIVSDCKILKSKNKFEVLYPIKSMDFNVYLKWKKDSSNRGSIKLTLWPPRKSIQFRIENDIIFFW